MPIVVRYNPTPHKVNLSADFHKITIKAGSRLRIRNNGFTAPLFGTELFFYAHIFQYDPATSAWIDYPTPIYNTFTTNPQNISAGSVYTVTLASDQDVYCKYGDAVYFVLEYDKTNASYPSYCYSGAGPSTTPLTIQPNTATSQFSCNIPSLQKIQIISSAAELPNAISTSRFIARNFFVTEDLEITADVNVYIVTP